MAFDDLTGGSGFTSDADGATANLDINLSDQSARNLWDVQAAVAQIAVDFQTAVRAASDFNSYLISIRETGQTIKMPSLGMEPGESGNLSYAGGRVDTGSVPTAGGMTGGEMGMAGRVQEMMENSDGMGGGIMGSRAVGGGPVDVAGLVGQASSTLFNAAFMHKMSQEAHGGGAAEPAATSDEMDQSPSGRSDSTTTPGGSGRGRRVAQTAIGLTQAKRFRQGAGDVAGAGRGLLGGSLGGVMGLLGKAGAYGAVAYGAYELGDAALQTYAQSRTMAIATNNSQHGSGWGFGTRASEAGMALSPFVNQDEASQIYNTAIDQGWASRNTPFAQGDFSSAVNFMYGAAKDYNMSPQVSGQLLQNNVLGAGESVSALSEQLLSLKKTLDGTGVSASVANQAFASYTALAIAQGMSPGQASVLAGGALASPAALKSTLLGPTGGALQIMATLQQSSGVQNMVGGMTGHMPAAAFATTQGTDTVQAQMHTLAVEYGGSNGNITPDQAANWLLAYAGLTGDHSHDNDINWATQTMTMMRDPNWFTAGQQKFLNSTTATESTRSGWNTWGNKLMDPGRYSTDFGFTSGVNPTDTSSINTWRNYSPEVNNLLQNSGGNLGNLALIGPDGKVVTTQHGSDTVPVTGALISEWLNDKSNLDAYTKPGSKYQIKDQTSGNTYNSQNIGLGGATGLGPKNGQNSNNTIYISLSPGLQGNPSTITLPNGPSVSVTGN